MSFFVVVGLHPNRFPTELLVPMGLGLKKWFSMLYLEAGQVRGFEVVGGAATPVHDVLILALAAQFPVPVGDTQVVVYHALTVRTVLQHSVEKRLQKGRDRKRTKDI